MTVSRVLDIGSWVPNYLSHNMPKQLLHSDVSVLNIWHEINIEIRRYVGKWVYIFNYLCI